MDAITLGQQQGLWKYQIAIHLDLLSEIYVQDDSNWD